MNDHYILVGQTPVAVDCDLTTSEGWEALERWAEWFETADRHVMRTELWFGLCEVSTIFQGLDHSLSDEPPRLFETMSFWGGITHGYHQRRTATWLDAERAHRRIVAECRRPGAVLPALAEVVVDGWWRFGLRVRLRWKKWRGKPLDEIEEALDRLERLRKDGAHCAADACRANRVRVPSHGSGRRKGER